MDPAGNRTEFDFDGLNRLVAETNELSDTRSFQYDAANNVTQITDRNGRVRELDYDHLHRLIEENWIQSSSSIYTATYEYDAANQLTFASDTFSTYTYTYDARGRTTLEEVDNGGPLVELIREFDLAGNRTALAVSFDVGGGFLNDFVNSYTFDNLYRLTRVDQAGVVDGNAVAEKRVDFTYAAASQFDTITRYKDTSGGSGNLVASSAFDYDDMLRLTSLTHTHDTTTIADYALAYDLDSRVTSLDTDALVGADGLSEYAYDNTSQIIDADHASQSDEAFSFDENGNRTMSGYTTGDNNRLTSDGVWNYGNDDEGNRVWQERISSASADDKRIEYTWDHRQRLTGIVYKNNSGTVTRSIDYVYDLFDRRTEKEIDWNGAASGGMDNVQYIYNGVHILLAFNGDDELTNRYLHGHLVDQVFADEHVDHLETPGDVLWLLTDNLGSVRDIVDNDGDVLNHITYSAFGVVTSETASAVDTVFGYAGRERDEESLLDFNRARYLDTTVGRFISEDPIRFAAGDTNLVRYVANTTPNAKDPDGRRLVFANSNSDHDNLLFLNHLLDLMDNYGPVGEALATYVIAPNVNRPVTVNIGPTNSPSDTVERPGQGALENHVLNLNNQGPAYLPPGSNPQDQELGPIMDAPPIVIGHELGHAVVGLADPANVTLVQNALHTADGRPPRPTYTFPGRPARQGRPAVLPRTVPVPTRPELRGTAEERQFEVFINRTVPALVTNYDNQNERQGWPDTIRGYLQQQITMLHDKMLQDVETYDPNKA